MNLYLINWEKLLERKFLWWRLLVIGCLVGISVSGFLNAYASELKLGIVNTEKILRESALAVKAKERIEQEFLPRDKQIKEMAEQARVLQEKLEKDGAKGSVAITEPVRRILERDLANLSREYQRAQRQMGEDLSVRQNEEYSVILDRTNKTIKNIAEKEKYDLILQMQDSVYRSERLDITEQVIKLLDLE